MQSNECEGGCAMTARITCGHCGAALDPDAPGAACLACHAEAGALREPDATPRRDTGAASGSRSASRAVVLVPRRVAMSQFERVLVTACALGPGDDLTDADMRLAASIHRSEYEA